MRLFSQILSLSAVLVLILAALLLLGGPAPAGAAGHEGAASGIAEVPTEAAIRLPRPDTDGPLSVEGAIAARRSVRAFAGEPVSLGALAQLLWAAQGVTGADGFKRAAPSAGAKYPIELFVVAGEVLGLPAGVYHYEPAEHVLTLVSGGDRRGALCDAALSQDWVRRAPLALLITAVYERTMEKYGARGVRYVHIEAGAVAENVYLQAESLGLGTTFVGAFSDEDVKEFLGGAGVEPLGVMPMGARER